MLDTDFIWCINSVEERDDMSLVKKGNALKRKSEETKSEVDILLNEVKNLKEKRRKLLYQQNLTIWSPVHFCLLLFLIERKNFLKLRWYFHF